MGKGMILTISLYASPRFGHHRVFLKFGSATMRWIGDPHEGNLRNAVKAHGVVSFSNETSVHEGWIMVRDTIMCLIPL
jgi:hypothetical protein